jgi:tetratricopeptide (TPR) repeat protein
VTRSRNKKGRRTGANDRKRILRPWLLCVAIGILLAAGVRVWRDMARTRQLTPPEVSVLSLDSGLRTIIETSRAAVVLSDESGGAWGKLGEALHAAEFHAQAQFCYSNAMVFDRANFRWPYLLGLLQLQDAPDRALQTLARATELAAGKAHGPRYQLGRALVERGRFDEAAPHLQTLLAADPGHAAARLELARVYFFRNALREATRELQPALSNSYTMRPALQLVAQMAQRNGQLDMAASVARRASTLPRGFDWPDPVLRDVQRLRVDRARLAEQAHEHLQQTRLVEAESALEKLLESFPGDPEGLLLLGRLRFVQKRCADAEMVFKRHLATRPDSVNGLVQLGLALQCQQRWKDAVAVLERVVQLKPDFAQAHMNLASARSKTGDSAGAIRAYNDALRCSPGDINTHMGLAEELANAGDVKGAAEHVERASALNPNDPRLAEARKQLGIK